ncbi:hypothetical protein [Pseudoflavonifractor phocaeensis]|uniref:hypothetical protein n=1 Tax=Pseudoflavonifractor phocaeensis TaxID=1870988 RepID=UPI001957D76C|nr:hypothetical protein [Pseudoflavonifractor phocaeensis]MBM6725356.1 hypothetical protein [Pseudoflavonifractor phocaeensis]
MNMTDSSNTIYLPYTWLNPTTGKAELGTYNYTAFLEKFQKQIEEAKVNPPELKDQTLSETEIQELAKKYDPQDMTQDEYDEFIRYLEEKGVLSRLETSDLGMSRITIVPGYFEPAYIWTDSSGVGSSVRSLSDVGGNALQFAQIMTKWKVPGSGVQIRQGAYSKVLEILSRMNAARGSTVRDQPSSDLAMDLSSIQLSIDRIKGERIQNV